MDAVATHGFLHGPDLHRGFCEECAAALMSKGGGAGTSSGKGGAPVCPSCGQEVERLVRVY